MAEHVGEEIGDVQGWVKHNLATDTEDEHDAQHWRLLLKGVIILKNEPLGSQFNTADDIQQDEGNEKIYFQCDLYLLL